MADKGETPADPAWDDLTGEQKQQLLEIASGNVTRRDVLTGAAALGTGAVVGGGASQAMSEPAAASHNGGTIGTASNPMEMIHTEGLSSLDSLSTESLNNKVQIRSGEDAQNLIEGATSGSVIEIEPNTSFDLSSTLTIPSNVTIRGGGSFGGPTTTLRAPFDGNIVEGDLSSVHLDGIEFDGAASSGFTGSGIVPNFGMESCLFQGVRVRDVDGDAFNPDAHFFNQFVSCRFAGGPNGYAMRAVESDSHISQNQYGYCLFNGAGLGGVKYETAFGPVHTEQFSLCTISDNGGPGLHLQNANMRNWKVHANIVMNDGPAILWDSATDDTRQEDQGSAYQIHASENNQASPPTDVNSGGTRDVGDLHFQGEVLTSVQIGGRYSQGANSDCFLASYSDNGIGATIQHAFFRLHSDGLSLQGSGDEVTLNLVSTHDSGSHSIASGNSAYRYDETGGTAL